MKYLIIWNDDHVSDSGAPYDALEDAKKSLALHARAQEQMTEGLNVKFDWDRDMLGFKVMFWSGIGTDASEDYFERYYRIHKIDNTGNILDEKQVLCER